jgi:tetratricopeptide (TPR) repeat protein
VKRLGGIITVLLVVFCAGTVISCASTKNAVAKDSKENKKAKIAEEHLQSLSNPMSDSESLLADNVEDVIVNEQVAQSANPEKMLPEVLLETECITAQMFNLPTTLIKEEIAEIIEEQSEENLLSQEELALADEESAGGSVLFTLQRAQQIKENQDLQGEIAGVDESQIERPVMSVLEERLIGYESDATLLKEEIAVEKIQPEVSTFEEYETELAVLPVISIEPIKPEAMIEEETYLAQVMSLPAIAQEVVIETTQVVPEENMTVDVATEGKEEILNDAEVATAEVLPQPRALEIALGSSVVPFGLPGSFVSPLANPDMVVKAKNEETENTIEATENENVETVSIKENKNVAVKENVQSKNVDVAKTEEIKDVIAAKETTKSDVVLPTQNLQKIEVSTDSVPEVVFAAKKPEEQNVALNEMLSVNKIEMPVVKNTPVAVENKAKEIKTAVAYVEVGEPEELEEVADFEMKPDFVFPQENVSCLENQETIIKMQGTGWRIEEMNRQVMELLERKIGKDNSTTFKIKNGNAGMQQIKFTRYNEDENRQEIQVYNVEIKPVLLTAENDKKKAPKAKKASKSKGADDYRRTLADHLYADENFSQAGVYYKKLIDENIADSELFYKAAHSMMKGGNADLALEYYQKNLAEEGNPFYDDAIIEYIQLLKEQKEFDKAINVVYERGLSKSVSEDCTQKLYRTLGDLFFNVKNYTEAIRTYKTVLSLYPAGKGEDKAMFYLAYALELQENPQFKEAQHFYRELLDVYPESEYVNLSRSRIGFINRHYIKVN